MAEAEEDASAKAAAAKAKVASKKAKKGLSPSEQLLIMCVSIRVACLAGAVDRDVPSVVHAITYDSAERAPQIRRAHTRRCSWARVLRRLFVMVGLAVTFYVITIGGLSRALPTTARPLFPPPPHSHYTRTLAWPRLTCTG